ncbi:MAG TPA: adenylate/guanylate cyclase domain-containing protein [Actinomycetota bacterium]
MTTTTQDSAGAALRAFMIADIRGYTRFTREHGDAAAARLAGRFAELARDAVEARGGEVLELRGDEALAVFGSTVPAVRAAIEFQALCAEEFGEDPTLPLAVGIGIDIGQAVPVEGGFRGVALNMAARLCSNAAAGQVLVSRAVADSASDAEGIRFESRGDTALKGFEGAVPLIEALDELPAAPPVPATATAPGDALAPELDPMTPLADRVREMRWLRGTWRQARRGRGRVLWISGPSQIGKTRLTAELASMVHTAGGRVSYAGLGGTADAEALRAIRGITDHAQPALLVFDDVDAMGDEVARELEERLDTIAVRPALVVATIRAPEVSPSIERVLRRSDPSGDGLRRLAPLDADGVRQIAADYVDVAVDEVPLEAFVRASGGIPGRVHEVVGEWAREEAGRRLAAAAEWLSEGRARRNADIAFANNVIGLKLGRLYAPAEGDDRSVCPYKGLATFEQGDAAFFFGRERLVGDLAARTVGAGLLGVVGASGSGKSSLVFAGLLPSLRAGLLPGSERWRAVTMRPGEHPLAELEVALAGTSTPGDPAEAVRSIPPEERLVLVVDQFEEIFTTCEDEDERGRSVAAICGIARSAQDRVVVVLTIRGDYYGHCARYPELAELLAANHVLVGSMTREELRRAIELPARRVGLRVESVLTDTLVEEIADQPGALPLLSTALVELWQESGALAPPRDLRANGRRPRRRCPHRGQLVPSVVRRPAGGRARDLPPPRRGRRGRGDHQAAGPPRRVRPRAGSGGGRGAHTAHPRSVAHDGRLDGRGVARGAPPGVAPPPGLARGRRDRTPAASAPDICREAMGGLGGRRLGALPGSEALRRARLVLRARAGAERTRTRLPVGQPASQ